MFKSLILENFRSLCQRQEIPLAPITLIFGANSAGKSSVLDSLLVLKQTIGQSESTDAILVPKGALVDLGSFREIVYGHELNRTFEIAPLLSSQDISWPLPRQSGVRPLVGHPDVVAGLGFRFQFDEASHSIRVQRVQQYWGSSADPLFSVTPGREELAAPNQDRRDVRSRRLRSLLATHGGAPVAVGRISDYAFQNSFWKDLYNLTTGTRHDLLNKLQAFVEAPEERQSLTQVGPELLYAMNQAAELTREPSSGVRTRVSKMKEMANAIVSRIKEYNLDRYLEDIKEYNESIRVVFQNFLPVDSFSVGDYRELAPLEVRKTLARFTMDEGFDLGPLVEASALELRRALNRMLYLGPLREYPERHYIFSGNIASEVGKSGGLLPDMLYGRGDLVSRLNKYMEKFEVGYTIEVFRPEHAGLEGVFSLQFKDNKTATTVSVRDVGFGLSQVLPVIVQSTLSKNRTILIEQPEIHLHPRLQADLGTLFAECSSQPNRNQFIVETHSEHLILRLQRLVRKRQLSPESLSVVYVTKGKEGSECHSLRIDERGDFIDPWPEGFFEEGFREMFTDL